MLQACRPRVGDEESVETVTEIRPKAKFTRFPSDCRFGNDSVRNLNASFFASDQIELERMGGKKQRFLAASITYKTNETVALNSPPPVRDGETNLFFRAVETTTTETTETKETTEKRQPARVSAYRFHSHRLKQQQKKSKRLDVNRFSLFFSDFGLRSSSRLYHSLSTVFAN